jgi:hypothetical protein
VGESVHLGVGFGVDRGSRGERSPLFLKWYAWRFSERIFKMEVKTIKIEYTDEIILGKSRLGQLRLIAVENGGDRPGELYLYLTPDQVRELIEGLQGYLLKVGQ